VVKTVSDIPFWYAIYTKPRDEERACKNLAAWNITTFAPKIKKKRFNQFSGEATYISQPLFPRYIFARFEAGRLLHKIYYTRGVKSVVSFNNLPLQVEDEIITLIQDKVAEDGYVHLGEEFKRGDSVTVKKGSQGISGIFERSMNDTNRVRILLNTISYQAAVIVEKEMVQKAAQPVCSI
jgi:transcription elongation factor/antiterminator RfaH